MTQTPFATNNSHLALCLEMVGQRRIGIQNRYNAAKLVKLGAATVKDALARSQPGEVWYLFARTPEIAELVVAYFDQEKKCKERIAGEAPDGITAADLLRIAVSALCLRAEYVHLWKSASVQLYEGGMASASVTESMPVTREMVDAGNNVSPFDGRTYQAGENMPIAGNVNYSAMKSVGINVPAEERAKVGL